ncbi:hypothetical protein NKJ26_32905 [Mesorhizobium sp. M0152]|uniref:hypothetical protein n=1 Tax=Mesorhizobium sp. M0152 TaxID=2956898 RepID=UPI0033373338
MIGKSIHWTLREARGSRANLVGWLELASAVLCYRAMTACSLDVLAGPACAAKKPIGAVSATRAFSIPWGGISAFTAEYGNSSVATVPLSLPLANEGGIVPAGFSILSVAFQVVRFW